MSFKIPGPKGAALGAFKAQAEAWVEAAMISDMDRADQIRKAVENAPKSTDRDVAIEYIRKKSKTGVKTTLIPSAQQPVRRTPIDTMRLAVNLLSISRKPFAEALMEAIQKDKITEPMVAELKTVCEAAMVAARKNVEYRDLFKLPETVK